MSNGVSGAAIQMVRTPISGRIMAKKPSPITLDISALKSSECAPISEDILKVWDAGLVSADEKSDNVIEIYGVIGEDWWTGESITSKTISTALKSLAGKDVEIRINSPGGDMFEGISIYNILAEHKGNVTVKITGVAASAASIIAMSGSEIRMGLGTFMMIHNCWVMAVGNRHDMMEVASYLEPFDMALRDIYMSRTNQSAKDVGAWMDIEKMFSANEAIENGFADALLDDKTITKDTKASERAKAFNAARETEWNLCKKGGKTRSQARALIAAMKGMPGAAQAAMPGAGDTWMKEAQDFIAAMKR
jgi:ATP-dependent protease ClpP protease subunit